MTTLFRVTCRGCETSFVSAHQVLLCSPGSEALIERCPHCGETAIYPRTAYYAISRPEVVDVDALSQPRPTRT